MLYDLPHQRDLHKWRKIKLLVAPPGSKEINYDAAKTNNTNKKASGKQKLKDLGLDDDEIKALMGA